MKNFIQNELVCLRALEPIGCDRYEELSKAIQWLDENTLKELCDETPIGRIGGAYELAEFIFTIATEKSGFLTGQIIGFDGGFAI